MFIFRKHNTTLDEKVLEKHHNHLIIRYLYFDTLQRIFMQLQVHKLYFAFANIKYNPRTTLYLHF